MNIIASHYSLSEIFMMILISYGPFIIIGGIIIIGILNSFKEKKENQRKKRNELLAKNAKKEITPSVRSK